MAFVTSQNPLDKPAPAWMVRLAALQVKRPWLLVAIVMFFAAIGAGLATRLELKTRFDQLLPDHQPSVVELRRVLSHVRAASKVYIVVEGPESRDLRAFGDRLAPELRTIGVPYVESAEDGLFGQRAYLEPRAGLFLKLPELTKLRDDVDARWDWEVAKQGGELEPNDEEPPAITAEELRRRFASHRPKDTDAFPDGYFQSKDRKTLVVLVHTRIGSGDLGTSREALAKIKAKVSDVQKASGNTGIKVSYAGDLVTGLAEYGAMADDLVDVGLVGVSMVLLVVFLYFMRLRALITMGVTIGVGIAWTFGFAKLTVGHLNIATGFLFSIIAGNGLNFGVIYMARYFEERRNNHGIETSVLNAHRTTIGATVAATISNCAAYGSLAVTDFRGFRHFAIIGAAGMVACWVATYVVSPAVLVIIERARPFTGNDATWFGRARLYGLPYAGWISPLVRVFAVPLTIASVLATFVGAGFAYHYVKTDPLEYNMRKLQNDLKASGDMYRASTLANEILGARIDGSMVILAERADQVPDLKKVLEARREAAKPDERPFEAVYSIIDFVAADQEKKVPILNGLAKKIRRAKEKGFIKDAEWEEVERMLPPTDLKPYTIDDLPDDLARPFTERDGTRGRLVLVEQTAGKNDDDLRYLLRWANALRETKLTNGEIVRGSGRPVIFADMLSSIIGDMPKAIGLALGLTITAVLLVFRRKNAGFVIFALAMGVAWLAIFLDRFGLKLNFFNFLALPITFGIGVDYAVNLMQRYVTDGERSILACVSTTGGAIVLCSLTTIVGYLALIRSVNQAIRSLGILAVSGEVACLAAAMIGLPAILLWREHRRKKAYHGKQS